MANDLQTFTFEVSANLAERLRPVADQLPHLLALGLREYTAASLVDSPAAAEVLEFLARLPTPDEVLALRASEALQAEVSALLAKNQTGNLSAAEQQNWQQYAFLEHLVRMAKATALLKLGSAKGVPL